ncbi:MAG: hypothetical protein WCF84_21340 [Anaerolineae bacterium]
MKDLLVRFMLSGILGVAAILLLGCTRQPTESPWEPVPTERLMALPLSGTWKLARVARTGAAPQLEETRTLTMLSTGLAYADQSGRRLTYQFVVLDAGHIQFTWTGSTNPNDKVGETRTQAYQLKGEELTLDGDLYQRVPVAPATLPTATTSATTVPASTPTMTSAGQIAARLDQPFALHIGQSAIIQDTPDGFGIQFVAVLEDSRCPKNADCIQAGQVRLHIEPILHGMLLQPLFELSTAPGGHVETNNGDYIIRFKQLDPWPTTTNQPTTPDAYVATFVISRLPASPTPRLNEPFKLKLSQWATLQDGRNTRIFFTNVPEDLRCWSGNCPAPGRARVLITVESGGKLAHLDLSTQPLDRRTVGSFAGYLVELVDLSPSPGDYVVTLRVTAGTLATAHPRLGEPFTLQLGQSASFENTDIQLIFNAVPQDSRCPARVTCATSGNAIVAVLLRRSGGLENFRLDSDLGLAAQHPQPFTAYIVYLNVLTPYPQAEFADKEIAPSDYQATFVVIPVAWAGPTATPPAIVNVGPYLSCPDLTRGDAEAILGEPVKPRPAGMLLSRLPTDVITPLGLCGYGSVAFTSVGPAQDLGVYPAAIQSDHAVIAGKLTNLRRQEQLLSVASVIDTANPNGADLLYNKLLTYYAAGAWSADMLADFPAAAEGATAVSVKQLDGLGNHAIWVWRPTDRARYAALIVQQGDTLFIVTALTGPQRTEDALQSTMMTVIMRMLQ